MRPLSTLARVQQSWESIYSLPRGLWQRFEEINPENLRELIKSLEIAVSNGWMGVSAEISEFIELNSGDLLETEPELRMRVEIERLKRFSYVGFGKAANAAGERALSFIQKHHDHLNAEDRLVWESVIACSCAWILKDRDKLQSIVERCREIDSRFQSTSQLRDLCASFMWAVEGRRAAVVGDIDFCKQKFRKAIELCEKHGLVRPLAHLNILYAESLALLNEWHDALSFARYFLLKSNDTPQRLFRSHLLLRAIIILLEAPEGLVSQEEFKYNAFRYQILIYATGLAPSQTVYPLLERARNILTQKSATFDIYHLDWRDELCRQIKQLNASDYERLIKFLYQALNYYVEDVPSHYPALDLLAVAQEPKCIIAIQVKHNVSKEIHKIDIPDDLVHEDAKEWLRQYYSITELDGLYWHTIKKLDLEAYRLLTLRVKNCFGPHCKLKIVELDELVNLLLDKPEILKRVVFSNQWKTEKRKWTSDANQQD